MSRNRALVWPDCYNVRDLGGLPTADGRTTKWGAVVRADMLNRLTDLGRERLINYGVRTVIDLRKPDEAKREPSLVEDGAILYRNLSMEGDSVEASEAISRAKTRAEVYCLVLDYHAKRIAAVMRALLLAPPGGVVIHCHAGKDRTGMIAGLLLELAGVPRQQIAVDYALSQQCLWPLYEAIVQEHGEESEIDPWLKPIAKPETMRSMLVYVDEKYSGIGRYLGHSGLTDEEVNRLKAILVDE